jgi:hypothetical protein
LPTFAPSSQPTASPTIPPSSLPSLEPSAAPSSLPSASPSTSPSDSPSALPTTSPSNLPSLPPSSSPTFQPSEVPVLSSAFFSDTAAYIYVAFTEPGPFTDPPTNSFSCSELFDFNFASSASCLWVNNTYIRVTSTHLLPDDTITLLSPKVETIHLSTPTTALYPQLVLTLPNIISSCANITIDATASTGNGNRPFSNIEWHVISNTSLIFAEEVTSYLNSFASASLYEPVDVPRNLLPAGSYRITLKASNFFGYSSQVSADLEVSSDSSLPSLSILGGSEQSYPAYSRIFITLAVDNTACESDSEAYRYNITIYDNLNHQSIDNVPTDASNDPHSLLLESYSLAVGQYQVSFHVINNFETIASISMTLHITSRAPAIRIRGGIFLQALVKEPLALDASASFDPNSDTTTLLYSWSCRYQATGGVCPEFVGSNVLSNTSIVTIPANTLDPNQVYLFLIRLATADDLARVSSKVIVVTPVALPSFPSTSIKITTTAVSANPDKSLVIFGEIASNASLVLEWQIRRLDGRVVTPSTNTPLINTFTASELQGTIQYPLSFPANSFQAGVSYRFRLFSGNVYAEIEIEMNIPPFGGDLVVNPSEGDALSTLYRLVARGWISPSIENIPLSYQFYYDSPIAATSLTLNTISLRSYLSTTLPSSAPVADTLIVGVTVTDTLFSTTQATASVVVHPSTSNLDDTSYLSLINRATSRVTNQGDINSLYQALSNIGLSIAYANCAETSAQYCASLSRQPCSSSSNLCGACLDGYKSIALGHANTPCYNSSDYSRLESVTTCITDSDCLSNNCENFVCTIPEKTCPSNHALSICSGHGTCQYTDAASHVIDSCQANDNTCFAACACESGYAGDDCALNSTSLILRDQLRGELCDGIKLLTTFQDLSGPLLDALVSSLFYAYSSSEITSTDTFTSCFTAFQRIINIASDGYLRLSQSSSITTMLELFSLFLRSDKFTDVSSSSLPENLNNQINAAIFDTLVDGQYPASFISSYIEIIIQSSRLSTLADDAINFPTSSAFQQGISFASSSAFASCYSASPYSKIAITQWYRNPFPGNSNKLASPFLQVASFNPPSSLLSRRLSESFHRNLSFTPLFYLTFEFASRQDFDFDAVNLDPTFQNLPVNTTIPVCNIYDTTLESYVSCNECEISSYNNDNVTFGCRDPSLLCEILASSGVSSSAVASRALQTNTQTSEDDFISTATFQDSNIISNLFAALLNSFVATLSTNPFSISPQRAVVVVSIAGTIGLAFLAGIFYFLRWDRWDHDYIIYIKKDEKAHGLKQKYYHDRRKNTIERLKKMSSFFLQDNIERKQRISLKRRSQLSSSQILEHQTILDDVTFPKHLLEKTTEFTLFMRALFRNHPYLAPFYGSSLRRRRVLRWISCMFNILTNLFVDTLFFDIFYPDFGFCDRYTTLNSCQAQVNQATGDSTCKWQASSSTCRTRDPPSSFFFIVILAMLTMIIAIPLQVMMDYLIEEYASKRPDFEQFGVSINAWFGSSTATHAQEWLIYGKNYQSKSMARRLSINGSSSMLLPNPSSINPANATSAEVYTDYLSASEEREFLTQKIRLFISQSAIRGYIPWLDGHNEQQSKNHSRLERYMYQLGIYPDGSPVPLTISQILRCTTRPEQRLESKIARARRSADVIIEEMESFDTANEDQLRNALLIQYFILEQVNFFRRYCVQKQLFVFHATSPRKIDPILWVSTWIYIYAACGFFLYWIFAWSARHSGDSSTILLNWGINFAISITQDLLFTQTIKVYIVYVAGVNSIKGQIKAIYHVLQGLSLRSMTNSSSSFHATSLVEYESDNTLRLCQYIYPSCRASRSVACKDLEAARMLRLVTDEDIDQCSKYPQPRLGWILLLIILPSILAVVSFLLADRIFEVISPVIMTGFLVINNVLVTLHVGYLIVLYVIISVLILYKLGIISSAYRKIVRQIHFHYFYEADKKGLAKQQQQEPSLVIDVVYRAFYRLLGFERRASYIATQRWKYLNIPYYHQGYSGLFLPAYHLTAQAAQSSSSARSEYDEYWNSSAATGGEGLVHEPAMMLQEVEIEIPTLIIDMYRKRHDRLFASSEESYNKTLENIFHFEQAVVHETKEASSAAMRYLDHSYTSSLDELLRRLVLKLEKIQVLDDDFSAALHYHSYTILLLDGYDGEHPLEDYLAALDDCWTAYYPYHPYAANKQLSDEIREEILEALVRYHTDAGAQETIGFKVFRQWYESIDKLIRELELKQQEPLSFMDVDVKPWDFSYYQVPASAASRLTAAEEREGRSVQAAAAAASRRQPSPSILMKKRSISSMSSRLLTQAELTASVASEASPTAALAAAVASEKKEEVSVIYENPLPAIARNPSPAPRKPSTASAAVAAADQEKDSRPTSMSSVSTATGANDDLVSVSSVSSSSTTRTNGSKSRVVIPPLDLKRLSSLPDEGDPVSTASDRPQPLPLAPMQRRLSIQEEESSLVLTDDMSGLIEDVLGDYDPMIADELLGLPDTASRSGVRSHGPAIVTSSFTASSAATAAKKSAQAGGVISPKATRASQLRMQAVASSIGNPPGTPKSRKAAKLEAMGYSPTAPLSRPAAAAAVTAGAGGEEEAAEYMKRMKRPSTYNTSFTDHAITAMAPPFDPTGKAQPRAASPRSASPRATASGASRSPASPRTAAAAAIGKSSAFTAPTATAASRGRSPAPSKTSTAAASSSSMRRTSPAAAAGRSSSPRATSAASRSKSPKAVTPATKPAPPRTRTPSPRASNSRSAK